MAHSSVHRTETCVVAQEGTGFVYFCNISYRFGGLAVDADFETFGAPVYKGNSFVVTEVGDCIVNFGGEDVTSVGKGATHVLSVLRVKKVLSCHLILRFKNCLRHLLNAYLFQILLLFVKEGGMRGIHEV